MILRTLWLPLAASLALSSATSQAAPSEAAAGDEAAVSETDTQPGKAAALASVVRGFYVEGRVGGGYTLVDAEIEADPIFPTLEGKSESLGAGATVHLAFGYDITERVALQALAGGLLISGQRRDRVRDLGILYGGLGGRLALELADRVSAVLSAGAAVARADDGVDERSTGLALMGGVGLEYYVHVRHFSVGVELAAFAPLSPSRVFLGVSPQVKYTF